MMVTWDIGRRCNLNCSYCESTRHDNVSPFHSLDELTSTFDFIQKWTEEYNSKRKTPSHTNINFTGGEPTMNPNFWNLVDLIKSNERRFDLSLTTNGAWNSKYTDKILSRFNGVTVSYHVEAHNELKKQIIDNTLNLAKSNIWLQVNLMLHTDHWDECMEIYQLFKSQGISTSPRPIGDGNVERSGWFIDADGTPRRTSHTYTREQQEWFWKEMGLDRKANETQQGTSIGRGCCGKRCIEGKVDNEWQSVKLVNTEFKGWNCTVDWYFLHIDQHTGQVYHHQTCQALPGGRRGALGNLSESAQLIHQLKDRLIKPSPIVCPNLRCGCGMCVPKAQDINDFNLIWNDLVIDELAREIP